MAIADALKALRQLQDEGVLNDYLVFGSVAAMAHTRPFFTRDVDIGVAVNSDSEYMALFRRLSEFGRVDGHSVVINGTPVEVFPVDISPIIMDAMAYAGRRLVDGIMVKVAPPEHLLLEALRVSRSQDKARVFLLSEVVDQTALRALFRRLDHAGTLARRFKSLTGKTP
jgi:hypothetical protein